MAFQLGGEIGALAIDHNTIDQSYTLMSLYNGTVWLGGLFTHVAGSAVTALAFVDPATGALKGTQLGISGIVTSTTGTKVAQMAVNPQQSQAVIIGNFDSVGGSTHKEVAVLDDASALIESGQSRPSSSWMSRSV